MKFYHAGEELSICPVYFYNMDANINTTGRRIKYLRETVNNWKGVEFLREIKRRYGEVVESSTLTNHEKDTSMPVYPTLINYAKTLGTTTDFLLLLTDDPAQSHKTDRNVVIEARGEEERRILEETSSLLEEMNVGDLRFVLDIVRRISAVQIPAATQLATAEIEPLIKTILDVIEQVGGIALRKKSIEILDQSLPPGSALAATWRSFRSQGPDQ